MYSQPWKVLSSDKAKFHDKALSDRVITFEKY